MSASDRHGELTSAQLRAVEVLLSGGEATAAAQAASVSTRTLRRWRREAAFSAALRAAGRARAAEAASVLLGAQGEALAVLRAALNDRSGPIRVQAAMAVMQLSQRAAEGDLDERLAALERRMEEPWTATDNGPAVWPA